jgi:hypothetical protein
LDYLEKHDGISVRTRNLRLTAIHSFFRYAAFEAPQYSAQIQQASSRDSEQALHAHLGQFSYAPGGGCFACRTRSAHLVWPA